MKVYNFPTRFFSFFFFLFFFGNKSNSDKDFLTQIVIDPGIGGAFAGVQWYPRAVTAKGRWGGVGVEGG